MMQASSAGPTDETLTRGTGRPSNCRSGHQHQAMELATLGWGGEDFFDTGGGGLYSEGSDDATQSDLLSHAGDRL